MAFLNANNICMGYTPTDYVVYSLKKRSTVDIVTPIHAPASSGSLGGMGIGALSGLGGYIGLGAKAKPCALRIDDKEGFIVRESKYINLEINIGLIVFSIQITAFLLEKMESLPEQPQSTG
jgi:hypothetical protein